MKKQLRSQWEFGEASECRRGLMRGMGYTEEELKRPLIGIVNSWNEYNPGHIHLNQLAERVKQGVREAGGLPVEVMTTGICDGMVLKDPRYIEIPSRNSIADQVEITVEGNFFDGMVMLSTCDSIVPGHLMAAARLDIPTILVTGGYMPLGQCRGKEVVHIHAQDKVGTMKAGKIDPQEYDDLIACSWGICGACTSMTTANSMCMIAEALGMKGWLSEEACRKMFELSGLDFDATIAAAKKPGFKSFTMKAKSKVTLNVEMSVGESHNVAAVLPGTDLKDEYVVCTAHWDHFGIGTPINGDSIYNGASDNASGVASLMLLAKKYQSLPVKPRRSIVFVAVTSEECGLLGSQYYCEHPLFPLSKTAINLNFDGTAPRERTHDVFLRAAGKTDTDALVVAMASAQGRTVKIVTEDPGGGYFRSDHFNFVKKGVPTVLVGPGNDYVDKARHEAKPKVYRYHQPNDEYDESWWDFDGAMENMNLMFAIGLVIANNDEMPKWTKDADFQRQP